eukprot:GEMP01051096.1.p2 GENE.GEMP01051096.1~~GEMP01051096.1.p2  ORF type:complete len:106 (+),score=3.82 GEMP01051096.1:100-417(+)
MKQQKKGFSFFRLLSLFLWCATLPPPDARARSPMAIPPLDCHDHVDRFLFVIVFRAETRIVNIYILYKLSVVGGWYFFAKPVANNFIFVQITRDVLGEKIAGLNC